MVTCMLVPRGYWSKSSAGEPLQVDVQQVNQELQSLKPARKGAPDPVSKLWPNHYSATVQRKHESGSLCISVACCYGEDACLRKLHKHMLVGSRNRI